jgi:hypothetical protein
VGLNRKVFIVEPIILKKNKICKNTALCGTISKNFATKKIINKKYNSLPRKADTISQITDTTLAKALKPQMLYTLAGIILLIRGICLKEYRILLTR